MPEVGFFYGEARVFEKLCGLGAFLPDIFWRQKSSQIQLDSKMSNQLQQFPGKLKSTCRKGRIAEYIREMDDLVENFGPGWGPPGLRMVSG